MNEEEIKEILTSYYNGNITDTRNALEEMEKSEVALFFIIAGQEMADDTSYHLKKIYDVIYSS